MAFPEFFHLFPHHIWVALPQPPRPPRPQVACREPRRFNEAELTGDEVVVLEVSGDGEAVKRFFSTPDSVALTER